MRKILLSIIFAVIVFCGYSQTAQRPDISGVTGAIIVENVQKTYHVKQNGGNDASSGLTEELAFKTITKAMLVAKADVKAGIPVKVLVYSGIYRETIGFVDFGTGIGKNTLFVFEGTSANDVIISGSDEFTGWQDEGNGIYSHSWTYDFGNNYQDWPSKQLGHRSEMVFVDNKPMRPRILENYTMMGNKFDVYKSFSNPKDSLTSGTFGVAERTENGNKIYVYPSAGTDMSVAKVDIAVRHEFIHFSAKENLIIRNITVQHFANRFIFPWNSEQPLTYDGGSKNILIEGCNILWNNGFGLNLGATDGLTIRNCNLNYNGASGFNTSGATNCIIENVNTNFNVWRNFYGGDTDWFAGGSKHHESNRMIVRNLQAVGNFSYGIWFDVHCKNVKVEDAECLYNYESGLKTEISFGPFFITKSIFAYNRRMGVEYYTVGEYTLDHCIVYGAGTSAKNAAIEFRWYPRSGNAHWERNAFKPGHISINNNIICGSASEDYIWAFHGNPGEPNYAGNYLATNNIFYHLSGNNTGKFYYGDWDWNTKGNYAGWLAWINAGKVREKNSLWQDPKFEAPEKADFRLKTESTLKLKECQYKCIVPDASLMNLCKEFFAWTTYVAPVVDGVPGGVESCTTAPEKFPTCTITTPTSNEILKAGLNVLIKADVTQSVGTISKVVFLQNGFVIVEDAVEPYECTWSKPVYGNYTLSAEVIDDQGLVGYSQAVKVKVNCSDLGIFNVQQDIGNPFLSGNACFSSNKYSIYGNGTDIWDKIDQFYYLYRNYNGEDTITAKVSAMDNTNEWAKAGIMLRDGTAQDAKFVMVANHPDNSVSMHWRKIDGKIVAYNGSKLAASTIAKYLKIVKSDSNYSGYYSADNLSWTKISTVSNFTMQSPLVGLCVTSHDVAKICNVAFTNVYISSNPLSISSNLINSSSMKVFPNPSYGTTTIELNLRQNATVSLNVFDLMGHKVACLLNSKVSGGLQTISWNGADANGNRLVEGMYFLQLISDLENTYTTKLYLMQ